MTQATEERAELDALIRAYAAARAAREAQAEVVKRLQENEDRATEALFDALERTGLRSVKHELGTFSLNDLAWPSITDPEAARQWALREMPELITLNNQRLALVVREFLKGDRAALPAGVDFRTSRKIGWRSRPGE